MLQQTQAPRVVDRFRDFLQRFPTPKACSNAGVGAIITAWQGLGYNRRAVALHAAATQIRARHQGEVPARQAELEALPGVGAYTARAIRAFAFSQRAAPVDVNIARVLARAAAGTPLDRQAVQECADAQLDEGRPAHGRPAEWSQALMDLGATYCRARRPLCGNCPVKIHCSWQQNQHKTPDPAATTAHRSKPQAIFEGSDRQYRGRLLNTLRRASVPRADIASVMGLDEDRARAERLADILVGEGLIMYDRDTARLP